MHYRVKKSDSIAALKLGGNLTQEQEFTLLFGVDKTNFPFRSMDAMRAAWIANRPELLASVNPGTRPSGWWLFESREGRDRNGPEALLELIKSGELTEGEAERLRRLGRELNADYWNVQHEAAWLARLEKDKRNG